MNTDTTIAILLTSDPETDTSNIHRCLAAGFEIVLAVVPADGSEPGELTVGEALTEIVPLHSLMSEKIEALRHWAAGRARHATHRDVPSNGRRKLDI